MQAAATQSYIPNRYKVPDKAWSRWSVRAQAVFNEVFCSMRGNQYLYRHPAALAVPAKHWSTTAWNAAWIAAEAVEETADAE